MNSIKIGSRLIGEGHPCFIVAEISANHNQRFEKAKRLIALAKESGADAVKIQTYTPDTMTIDCDNKYFKITEGPWKGQTLYDLYKTASTPWEWQPDLKKYCESIGITFFSTPFDVTSVEFLEKLGVPAYKIASFELVDIPLISAVASKGKPIILSTGMSTLAEIETAVQAIQKRNNNDIVLLKCTSDYPAIPEEMNIKGIQTLAGFFNVPVGLSDHSLNPEISVAAVALGASVIEKHFIDSRSEGGPDAHFSMEPNEFRTMVSQIRIVEKAIGTTKFFMAAHEKKNTVFRRSLFVVEDIKKGEILSNKNVRSIRPGYGLEPKYIDSIIGKNARLDIKKGSPLNWTLIE